MRDKLFWKDGSFVPSLSNSYLTILQAVLVQDRRMLSARGYYFHILSPPSLILTYFLDSLVSFDCACCTSAMYVRPTSYPRTTKNLTYA